jgi:hypothetical protein
MDIFISPLKIFGNRPPPGCSGRAACIPYFYYLAAFSAA